MAEVSFKGNPVHTNGELPAKGAKAPEFVLVNRDMQEVSLYEYGRKKKILNIFVSVDTNTCALSVRTFNKKLEDMDDVILINISKDLPFALNRFFKDENIENADALSAFRSTFAQDYGLELIDSPLKGLCSRAVLVLDEDNTVIYRQQVQEIGQEPDYIPVLEVLEQEHQAAR